MVNDLLFDHQTKIVIFLQILNMCTFSYTAHIQPKVEIRSFIKTKRKNHMFLMVALNLHPNNNVSHSGVAILRMLHYK